MDSKLSEQFKQSVDALYDRQKAIEASFTQEAEEAGEIAYRQTVYNRSDVIDIIEQHEARTRDLPKRGYPLAATQNADRALAAELAVVVAKIACSDPT